MSSSEDTGQLASGADSTLAETTAATAEEERVYVASQWRLVWWRFRRHKLAIVSAVVLGLFYAMAVFCEFVAVTDPDAFDPKYTYMPPQRIRFVDESGFRFRPFVYGTKQTIVNFDITYREDPSKVHQLYLFVHGTPYKLWGLFDSDLHLVGLRDEGGTLFLLGTDRLGRDVLSRMIYGSRISLSIGLVGVFVSLVLGVLIGVVSGYYGGFIDTIIQRVVEFIRCIPTIPLWMALSAALPLDWPPLRVYFGITVVLSLVGWIGLARVVRGKFLSLREEDFVLAARIAGASEWRIITRHLVPSFTSHLIASLTLSLPNMIMGETSLSFLGLGLRPPTISWGVLLQSAQQLSVVALSPWLMSPVVFIVLVMLAFNFVGDGLRDAADPYSR